MPVGQALHLIKLCVGAEGVDDLVRWQNQQRRMPRFGHRPVCTTRNTPRRAGEILEGGSLYWVFRGLILARQRVIGFEPLDDEQGRPRCGIVLDGALVRTEAQACRPFQGWRYLSPADAPADLAGGTEEGATGAALPPDLDAALVALGVTRRRR
jgi:hypothetical protein